MNRATKILADISATAAECAERLSLDTRSRLATECGALGACIKVLCAEIDDAASANGLPHTIRSLGSITHSQACEILSAVSDLLEAQREDWSLVVAHLQEAKEEARDVTADLPSPEEAMEWRKELEWDSERRAAA